MKRILVDIDAVVADLMTVWLGLYNKEYEDSLELQDITKWGIHEIVKPECGIGIFKYLERHDLYDSVLPVDGAKTSIAWLRNHSYDVRFLTSGIFESKAKWMYRHNLIRGDWMYSPDIIVSHDKSLIKGDILIDDNIENLHNFDGKRILFAQPWNEGNHPFFRADGWADVIQYIVRGI